MPLQVVLAGHNLDHDLLLEVRSLLEEIDASSDPASWRDLRQRVREMLERQNWTPETLSAAYARVSRDPRSVTELRRVAREEVDQARRSNETIVFGLGHASVAEHAVFNLDLLGLSRLAVEIVERQRLASFTEKSQRYILLEEDWVLPEEVKGTPVENQFRRLIAAQHTFYRHAYERLLPWVLETNPDLAAEKRHRRTLEGLAKEDARYALGLSTTVQLGETINARGLEGLVARCRAHALVEVRELGEALHRAVAGIAPSLVKYTEPTMYMREARHSVQSAVASLEPERVKPRGQVDPGPLPEDGVRLVTTTPDPDTALLATLLFAGDGGSMADCRQLASRLDGERRVGLVRSHLRHLGPHDPVLREYEHVDLVYDLVVSASCFAQLKRHRMTTQTPLAYDPALGLTVPPAFRETGLEEGFQNLARQSEECAGRMADIAPRGIAPDLAAYALTNAHRRRVLVKCNARELYHISRLREDVHAQWDIRRLAGRMVDLAREVMPLTLLMAAGKDHFEARRREIFGADPPSTQS